MAMQSPRIFLKLDTEQPVLRNYLSNIGSLVEDKLKANVIIADNTDYTEPGFVNFVLTDEIGEGYIMIPLDFTPQEAYQRILHIVMAVNKFYKGKESSVGGVVIGGEERIVAGFARHFSHNVLNALLMTSGFMRMIKANTNTNDQVDSLWKSVDQKLGFIEELVNGYSDYYQVINLKPTDNLEVSSLFHDMIVALANKNFEKTFSAHLTNYKNDYEISHHMHNIPPRNIPANGLFLKLALCYIIKDTIRYMESSVKKVFFRMETDSKDGRFVLNIYVVDVNLPEDIIASMFKPWDHNIFLQSFDYWGIVIANTVFVKHGGELSVINCGKDLKISIRL